MNASHGFSFTVVGAASFIAVIYLALKYAQSSIPQIAQTGTAQYSRIASLAQGN